MRSNGVPYEENPICECSHAKITHGKHGCDAWSIGCLCGRTYELLTVTPKYVETTIDEEKK